MTNHNYKTRPKTTEIVHTERSILENRLLAYLDEREQVAVCLDRQTLDDLIHHLGSHPKLNEVMKTFHDDLILLKTHAFPRKG